MLMNFLNKLIRTYGKKCFKYFVNPDIPIISLGRDELDESLIDEYLNENPTLFKNCQDVECTKKQFINILNETPIILFSKEVGPKRYREMEANKPLFIDPYILQYIESDF